MALTSYKASRETGAARGLCAVAHLVLDPNDHIEFVPLDGGQWMARMTLCRHGHSYVLEVFEPTAKRDAWFRTDGFAAAYDTLRGDDPFGDPLGRALFESIRQHITSSDGKAKTTQVITALEDIEALKPLIGGRDEDFREVLGDGESRVGLLRLCACSDGTMHTSGLPGVDDYQLWLREMAQMGIQQVIFASPSLQCNALTSLIGLAVKTHSMSVVVQGVAADIARLTATDCDELNHAGVACVSPIVNSLVAEQDTGLSHSHHNPPVTEGIRACIQSGLSVVLRLELTKHTFDQLLASAQLCANLREGPEHKGDLRSVSIGYFGDDTEPHDLVGLSEISRLLEPAVGRVEAAGIEVKLLGPSGLPPCVLPPSLWAARQKDRPRLTEHDRRGLSYAEPCTHCSAKAVCPGVLNDYLDVHGTDGLHPL